MHIKYKKTLAMFLLVVFTTTFLASMVSGKAAAVSVAPIKAGEFTALYVTKSKAGNLYISGYYRTNWTPCRLTMNSADQTPYRKDETYSGKHTLFKKKITPGKVCTLKLITGKHETVTKSISIKDANHYQAGKKYKVYPKPR